MFYKIIYFQTYKFFVEIGEHAIPRSQSVLLMSFINIIHFGIIMFITDYLIGYIPIATWPNWALLIIGLLIIFINMAFIFLGKKYEKIEIQFENYSQSNAQRRSRLVVLYYILSVITFITLVIVNY